MKLEYFLGLILGGLLTLAGLVRSLSHPSAPEILTLPGCAGNVFVIELGPSAASQAHCWGCAAILAGLFMVAGTLALAWRARHDYS